MSTSSIQEHTFQIERFYARPAGLVFNAFADPARKRRWYAESDSHVVEDFVMQFEVGGEENLFSRLNESTPFAGTPLVRRGRFLDIVPDQRIVTAATMEFAGRRISAALETFAFIPADGGTRVVFTHQAVFFEGADGPDMRRQGWEGLLERMQEELAR